MTHHQELVARIEFAMDILDEVLTRYDDDEACILFAQFQGDLNRILKTGCVALGMRKEAE